MRPPAEGVQHFWLPADEEFRKLKQDEFYGDTKTGGLQMVSTIVKEAFLLCPTDNEFPTFESLQTMYEPSEVHSPGATAPPKPGGYRISGLHLPSSFFWCPAEPSVVSSHKGCPCASASAYPSIWFTCQWKACSHTHPKTYRMCN